MTKTESSCNGNVDAKPKKAVTYTIVKSNINEEYKTILSNAVTVTLWRLRLSMNFKVRIYQMIYVSIKKS